jgi:cytochrome b involved in lipid metabolism
MLQTEPKKYYTWKQINQTIPKPYTTKAVEESEECLIVIKNRVYNIAGEFAKWHPGGSIAFTKVFIKLLILDWIGCYRSV